VDATSVAGYTGAAVSVGAGKLTWTKRIKALGAGTVDFTGVNTYSLTGDGTGTVDLSVAGVGTGARVFVGSSIHPADPVAYEIWFGAEMPTLSGSGVFLNPQGVVNAASFAPPGNPISPGQFVALFGSGLARSTQVAAPPYPASLNGVSVTINGRPAPIYFVSDGQVNCLVPFATTGATATIVVNNNGASSNTVTVPMAGTSPGVYTVPSGGVGSGAILHADFSLVSDASPAAAGETVLVFLTGMGTTNPTVTDGTAGTVTTLYRTQSDATLYVGGKPGVVAFNGLAPGFPGLYQINLTLPSPLPGTGRLPLSVATGNAFHDQVDIAVK
jgi:uncharacterized protein (TIGR03437 family)